MLEVLLKSLKVYKVEKVVANVVYVSWSGGTGELHVGDGVVDIEFRHKNSEVSFKGRASCNCEEDMDALASLNAFGDVGECNG